MTGGVSAQGRLPMFVCRRFLVVFQTVFLMLILAIVLRTFFVIGLLEPVLVAGSSMAPSLCGPHCVAVCQHCEQSVRVAAEFVPAGGVLRCPHCGRRNVDFSGAQIERGDSLLIDRTAFNWRGPRRWETVVFCYPHDGGPLCVKRIVGLPGETVELRGGDVLVDGSVVVKSLAQQRAVRQRVFRKGCLSPHGHAGVENGQPLTDDLAYNGSLSRRINFLSDFMLSAQVENLGSGWLVVQIDSSPWSVRVDANQRDANQRDVTQGQGLVEIRQREQQVKHLKLSQAICERIEESFFLEISTFDSQLLVAIDSQVLLRYPLPAPKLPEGTAQPFVITAWSAEVDFLDWTLWRDIYYTQIPVGIGPTQPVRHKLAAEEWFVLGDNSPISLDSRVWGPLPRRLLFGKPLGIR